MESPLRLFTYQVISEYRASVAPSKVITIILFSSSKQDMMKYMKEQQMPWIGISYEGDVAEEFRKKFRSD